MNRSNNKYMCILNSGSILMLFVIIFITFLLLLDNFYYMNTCIL